MFDKVPAKLANRLADTAMDVAFEWLCEQPKDLADLAFGEDGPLRAHISGIGFGAGEKESEYPGLSVIIRNFDTDEIYKVYDLIGEITTPVDEEVTDYERRRISRAIAALQSGIDRIRAYEAERLRGAMK